MSRPNCCPGNDSGFFFLENRRPTFPCPDNQVWSQSQESFFSFVRSIYSRTQLSRRTTIPARRYIQYRSRQNCVACKKAAIERPGLPLFVGATTANSSFLSCTPRAVWIFLFFLPIRCFALSIPHNRKSRAFGGTTLKMYRSFVP